MDSYRGTVLSHTLIVLFVSDTIAERIMTCFWLYFTLINLETEPALGGKLKTNFNFCFCSRFTIVTSFICTPAL